MKKYAIRLPETLQFSDDKFFAFCQENRNLQFERNAHGEITEKKNSQLNAKLDYRDEETGLGEMFNSSTGFILPNGATHSPDAAWVKRLRWEASSYEQQEKFPPLCPDFVVELISSSDTLKASQLRMDEWMANGCRLGGSSSPNEEKARVYEGGGAKEVVGFDQALSGETVQPGFSFELSWLK